MCDAPHRDGARYAFGAIAVRGRASGPHAIAHAEARIGDRRETLALTTGAPGAAVSFAGHVPIDGLPRGRQALTVVARDAAGREASVATEVDVQPFDVPPPAAERWPALVAEGRPIVHVEACLPGRARPGWPNPVVVAGFAYCTQGLARLAVVVDDRHGCEPFHGLYRPDLEATLGNRAAVAGGFRGELLDLGYGSRSRELVVLAVAPDGRATGWRGTLASAVPAAVSPPPLPPLQPAPRRRAAGAPLAAAGTPPGAEAWAEHAVRLEAEREAADTDRAWAGLQTRLALERAAETELARRAAVAHERAMRKRAGEPIAFPEVPDPLVSVVVTVHEDAELTERCLRALARAGGDVPFEVIVVDDGDDPAVARLLDAAHGTRIVRAGPGLGYLRSANRGALAARGTHIVQLNNDTEPQPGWLDALVGRLDADERTGVVVAKLLFPDGRLQEAGSIVWADGSGWSYGGGDDETAAPYDVVRDVDYGSAAAMLVRGSVWRALGGFDERFVPAYYEDVDLCFSARARGWRVVYEPAARVVHVRGGSMGDGDGAASRRLIDANRLVFARKWATALADHAAFDPAGVHAAADRIARTREPTG